LAEDVSVTRVKRCEVILERAFREYLKRLSPQQRERKLKEACEAMREEVKKIMEAMGWKVD